MVHYKKSVHKALLMFIVLILPYSCRNSAQEVEFIWLKQFDYTYTTPFKGNHCVTKGSHFIIKGYRNKTQVRESIDSFAMAEKKKQHNVDRFSISFYRFSELTNPKYLRTNPKEFYRDAQDDILFGYSWSGDELVRKAVYDNGKRID